MLFGLSASVLFEKEPLCKRSRSSSSFLYNASKCVIFVICLGNIFRRVLHLLIALKFSGPYRRLRTKNRPVNAREKSKRYNN